MEYRSNWIRAAKGAVINYGEVDFGSKAPLYLEIELAASAENAGGQVKLYDITGDNQPDSVLAEITTEKRKIHELCIYSPRSLFP